MRLKALAWCCIALAIALMALVPPAASEPGLDSQWIGMWQAKLDGQPGVTLTLGDDAGQIGGAVVFHLVSREGGQPHVIGNDAHILMNPRIEGDTLHFQVIRKTDNVQLDMTMRITTDNKAQLECLKCSADVTVAAMEKLTAGTR